MAARATTAFVGSHAAASGIATLTPPLLPIARVEATAWAMVRSFALYAVLLLWAFHEQRLGKVVLVVWGSPSCP